MKKEKQVKSYQRRTKSGKTVTVRAHTAKYEAADKAKEAAKKKGAGKELEERMSKKPVQLEIPFDKEEEKKVLDEVKDTAKKESSKKPAEKKTTAKATRYASGAKLNEDGTFVSEKDYKKSIAHRKRKGARISPEEVKAIKKWESGHKESKVRPVGSGTNGPEPKKKTTKSVVKDVKASSEPAFTAAEFKEWYRGTGSAADKKVAKALRAQLGRSGYRKLEDEAIDNYTSRGHLSMFKKLGSMSGNSSTSTKGTQSGQKKMVEPKTPKVTKGTAKNIMSASKVTPNAEDVLGFSLPKSWQRQGKELRYSDTTTKGKSYMDKFVSKLEKSGWKKVSDHHNNGSSRVWYVSPDSSHELMYEYIDKAGSFRRFTSAFIRRKAKNG